MDTVRCARFLTCPMLRHEAAGFRLRPDAGCGGNRLGLRLRTFDAQNRYRICSDSAFRRQCTFQARSRIRTSQTCANSARRPIRPFRTRYAFDPRRTAILLSDGDQTGDECFYQRMIPRAASSDLEWFSEWHAPRRWEGLASELERPECNVDADS